MYLMYLKILRSIKHNLKKNYTKYLQISRNVHQSLANGIVNQFRFRSLQRRFQKLVHLVQALTRADRPVRSLIPDQRRIIFRVANHIDFRFEHILGQLNGRHSIAASAGNHDDHIVLLQLAIFGERQECTAMSVDQHGCLFRGNITRLKTVQFTDY